MLSRLHIRIAIAAVIITGISGYTAYEFRNLLRGPVIVIESPKTGDVFQTSVAEIKGKVINTTQIKMNDRDISIDEEGVFKEKFVLSEGNNVVKVSAKDRFGRREDVYLEVLYNGPGETLTRK